MVSHDSCKLVHLQEGLITEMEQFTSIYRLEAKLGHGCNGVVHEVTRICDDCPFIAKIVQTHGVGSHDCCQKHQIPQEIVIMNQVKDVHGVIRIVDYFILPFTYIIVMDKFSSTDLYDYIRDHGILLEDVTKDIFRQVVHALLCCGTRGVFHGDIKDENILINVDTKQIKLIDFGCGKFASSETICREYTGTQVYSPPEWLTEHAYKSEGLAVWTLGIVLFKMVNGYIPFNTPEEVTLGQIKSCNRISMSKNLKNIIAGCLAVKQDQRLTLSDVWHHPWFQSE